MRQVGRLGVWYPVDRLNGAGIRRLLRTVEGLGYSTLWYPEALGYESLSIASFMLANSTRLIIGSSIANIYARDPFTARRGLSTLSSLYDDRFILGLGVSHAPMVERVRGHVYDKPVPTMRRYLDGLYENPSNAAEWPVVIAALGPLMLKLAAERTAGAVPYNVTPEHTREARAALGPDKLLVVEQKVCLETDSVVARGVARRELHRYLTLTNYRNNWLRIGFTEADLADGGSDRFLDAMVLRGDATTIAHGLRAHSGRQSSLRSAGPCGGRHGSARQDPDGARRWLSLFVAKPGWLEWRSANVTSLSAQFGEDSAMTLSWPRSPRSPRLRNSALGADLQR
jgi:probable F420-dependent oxidoreductase